MSNPRKLRRDRKESPHWNRDTRSPRQLPQINRTLGTEIIACQVRWSSISEYKTPTTRFHFCAFQHWWIRLSVRNRTSDEHYHDTGSACLSNSTLHIQRSWANSKHPSVCFHHLTREGCPINSTVNADTLEIHLEVQYQLQQKETDGLHPHHCQTISHRSVASGPKLLVTCKPHRCVIQIRSCKTTILPHKLFLHFPVSFGFCANFFICSTFFPHHEQRRNTRKTHPWALRTNSSASTRAQASWDQIKYPFTDYNTWTSKENCYLLFFWLGFVERHAHHAEVNGHRGTIVFHYVAAEVVFRQSPRVLWVRSALTQGFQLEHCANKFTIDVYRSAQFPVFKMLVLFHIMFSSQIISAPHLIFRKLDGIPEHYPRYRLVARRCGERTRVCPKSCQIICEQSGGSSTLQAERLVPSVNQRRW